ncbi:MAG: hypothetical protein ACE5IB_01275 [Candidatus Geothermarchaeales archaeon]
MRRWFAALGVALFLSSLLSSVASAYLVRVLMLPHPLPEEVVLFYLSVAVTVSVGIGLPFAVVFLTVLTMPELHSRRSAVYLLLITSLVSSPIASIAGPTIAEGVFPLGGEWGVSFDVVTLASILLQTLYGLHLFFLAFAAYVLATWRKTPAERTGQSKHRIPEESISRPTPKEESTADESPATSSPAGEDDT